MKSFNISNISDRDMFQAYYAILDKKHRLTEMEYKVLAELNYHAYLIKDEVTSESLRWRLVFTPEVKNEICEYLDVKTSTLNNALTSLRSKGVIVNNKVISDLLIYPSDSLFKLEFNFRMNVNKDSKESSEDSSR